MTNHQSDAIFQPNSVFFYVLKISELNESLLCDLA